MLLTIDLAKGLIGSVINEACKDIYKIYLDTVQEYIDEIVNNCWDSHEGTNEAWVMIDESWNVNNLLDDFKTRLLGKLEQQLKIDYKHTLAEQVNAEAQVNEPSEIV